MNQEEFNDYKQQGFNHIPVFRQIEAYNKNVLATYYTIANTAYSYLFESSHDSDTKWGRYSIIGLKSQKIIKIFDNNIKIYYEDKCIESLSDIKNPLDWIESYKKQYIVPKIKELPDFYGGFVGYFGYEVVRYIEPKLAKKPQKEGLDIPDILLMLSNDLVVFDNKNQQIFLITHIDPNNESLAEAHVKLDIIEKAINSKLKVLPKLKKRDNLSFISQFGEQKYKKAVKDIQEYIIKGDVMQVVPSQRLSNTFTDEPLALYKSLTTLNPSPYMYFLHLNDMFIVGSSPEILTRVENNKATVRPLAGTRNRGKTKAEDLALEKDLLADEKEIAEHLMLIDLGRNDLGRVAKIGSVKVSDKMNIERYSHVMHIVSNVECTLKDNISALDVFKATFPAGTLSGAPKVRAMEIIDEVETIKRNIYSGAIGYISWHDNMDLAIAIRTAVIKDKQLFVQAGAGIVYDSIPELEWQETMHKAQAVIGASRGGNDN
ncbi:Anthranilate synthase, aminase component [hydrothermal vent metagenome]|uniref:Anthranilate synthase component 1 n=1 Tax=hydrothermal vent metagenome TaxID=652676 RepID=A0A1W1C0M0_9ZZZZ